VITWDGGAGSINFADKANWSGDQIPGPNDDVVIPSQFSDSVVLISGPVTLRSIRSEAKVIQIESAPGQRDSQLTVTAGASLLSKGIFLTNWYGSGYQYITYKATANSNSVGGTMRITATGPGTSLSLGREFDTIAPYFFGKAESDFPTDINPQLVTAKDEAKITASDGARIDIALQESMTMRFHEISYVSTGVGSRIDGNGIKYFGIDMQSEFYVTSHAGGVVSFPDLRSISRDGNVVGMKLAMTSDGTRGGTISMPELKSIGTSADNYYDNRQTAAIEISGNSTFDTPKLETLKNAVLKLSGTSPLSEPVFRGANDKNLINTDLRYDVKGGAFRLDLGKYDMSGSIYVSAGKFELIGKISYLEKDLVLESSGPDSELNVQIGYIPSKLGNFVRVSAINGGRLTIGADILNDASADRPDGGVYLKAESGGVLQSNATWISGAILDVTPNSTIKLPNLVDGDFEQIRGYNGSGGRIEAPKLQILMVKKYEDLYYEVQTGPNTWDKYRANRFPMSKLEAPNLVSVLGDFIDLGNWVAPKSEMPRTVTFVGSNGGYWSDVRNWSDGRLPGPNTNVIVPDLTIKSGNYTYEGFIEIDVPVRIASVNSGSKLEIDSQYDAGTIRFEVTAGASKITGKAWFGDVMLVASNPGTSLEFTNEFLIANTRTKYDHPNYPARTIQDKPEIRALNGSTISIIGTPVLNYVNSNVKLTAIGNGSRISIPQFESLRDIYDKQSRVINTPAIEIVAQDGARIDLPKLNLIKGNRLYADIRNSTVDLSSLTNLSGSEIRLVDTIADGKTSFGWIAPKLESLTSSSLFVRGADATQTFGALKNVNDTDIRVEFAKAYLPNVTTVDLNTFFGTTRKVSSEIPDTRYWFALGKTALLELGAASITGSLAASKTFLIMADAQGSVTLNVPVMQLDQTDPAQSGTVRLYVDDRSVIRAKAEKISGLTLVAKGDGAIAVDEAQQADFKAITNETGKVYAARLTDLTVGKSTDTVQAELTWLDRIVAPNSNQITGAFQAVANPLAGLKSITGKLMLRHQPGTPVSQATLFDTPAIGTISNLTVYLEEGVTWPQLFAQPSWQGLTVMRIKADGTLEPIAPPNTPPPVVDPPNSKSITWDGGAGTNKWSDAANWSGDRLPTATSEVVIPATAAVSEILVDRDVEIANITSQKPLRLDSGSVSTAITLRVTSGASVLYAGATLKGGTLATKYSGTTLDVGGQLKLEGYAASATSSAVSKSGLEAAQGSWLTLQDTSTIVAGLVDFTMKSSGGGAKVMMPKLTALHTQTSISGIARSAIRFSAADGGAVETAALKSMSGDAIDIDIRNSWITMTSLSGLRKASIRVLDTTDDGVRNADWLAPNLAFLERSSFATTGRDITFSFDKVTSVTQTNLATTGSKLYFPAIDKVDFGAYFQAGDDSLRFWSASGAGGLLEVKAGSIGGDIKAGSSFAIIATDGALAAIHSPSIMDQRSAVTHSGGLFLKASSGGVIRSYATTTSGAIVDAASDGAVAMDQVGDGRFHQIRGDGGKFYASSMTSLTVTDPNAANFTKLNAIVAPQLKSLNWRFESVGNPFPGLSSITGSIRLRHEAGTPVSQITIFDTPAIGSISNLEIEMEEGVRWPQLESLANWNGLSVYRLGSDGSRTPIAPVIVQPVSAAAMAATATPKAASKNKSVAAAKQQPKKVAAKPAPKPKVVAKPAPRPKVAAKPQPKKVAVAKR
ncbi:hypothetical protein GC170_22705, partial [bacterium]|nr:hypothetical protein [bacterium]